jgi:hypothetical protein
VARLPNGPREALLLAFIELEKYSKKKNNWRNRNGIISRTRGLRAVGWKSKG